MSETTPTLMPTGDDVWTGRVDGDGPEHARWHSRVTRESGGTGGVALVGFASDAGVARNHGRVGAAEAPDALRRALSSFAWHGGDVPLVDAGTVAVAGDPALEGGQEALGAAVAAQLDAERLVVVLGGGHETAWGSYLGRAAAARLEGRHVAVVNVDAHYDLREADRPTSGTPFLQMARADEAAGRRFDYTVVGIAETGNTRVLFETAERLGVTTVTDAECAATPDAALAAIDAAVDRADAVHLSIDIDVLPAAVAPGVSAPAGLGVDLTLVNLLCRDIAASGKLALVDVVEVSPPLDENGRTARVAARLAADIVHVATRGE